MGDYLMKRVLHLLGVGSLALATLIVVSVVSAHEQRTIANGKYDVEVGWLNEPTVVNQPNGATIEIHKAGAGDAITGVESTLKVDIAAGGKDEGTFLLHTVPGKPGLYAADYTPPVIGSYVFTFTGTIEGNTINEKFESGPGRFDDVVTAEEAAKITPQSDEASAATQAASEVATAPSMVATEAIVAAVPTPTIAAPLAPPAAQNSDSTVAIVIGAVIVVLVVGGLFVLRRKP